MGHDVLEFGRGGPTVFQLKVGLASKIGGPELRRGRVIVTPDRLQQGESSRRVALLDGDYRSGHRQRHPVCERRVRKPLRDLA